MLDTLVILHLAARVSLAPASPVPANPTGPTFSPSETFSHKESVFQPPRYVAPPIVEETHQHYHYNQPELSSSSMIDEPWFWMWMMENRSKPAPSAQLVQPATVSNVKIPEKRGSIDHANFLLVVMAGILIFVILSYLN